MQIYDEFMSLHSRLYLVDMGPENIRRLDFFKMYHITGREGYAFQGCHVLGGAVAGNLLKLIPCLPEHDFCCFFIIGLFPNLFSPVILKLIPGLPKHDDGTRPSGAG